MSSPDFSLKILFISPTSLDIFQAIKLSFIYCLKKTRLNIIFIIAVALFFILAECKVALIICKINSA